MLQRAVLRKAVLRRAVLRVPPPTILRGRAEVALRIITFDLDDTLWDVRPALIRAEHDTRAWLAAQVPDMAARFDANALHGVRNDLVAADPTITHQLSRLRRDTYREAMIRTGYPAAEALRLADAAFKVFLDGRNSIEPFEGVPELLAELAGRYVLGALSNGNADLSRLAIGRHFAFHFSAEQVGAAKPHPAMFDAALAHPGAERACVLHVGDNAEHDIVGATRAGLRSVWINAHGAGYPPHLEATPVAEIAHVLDLPQALATLEG